MLSTTSGTGESATLEQREQASTINRLVEFQSFASFRADYLPNLMATRHPPDRPQTSLAQVPAPGGPNYLALKT